MGQYYRGAILDLNSFKKNEINVVKAFCCFSHNNGAKLMEHSYVENWYVKEYEKALATEFFGMPFVWVGDYADEKFDTDVYSSAISYIVKKTKENASTQGFCHIKGCTFAEFEKVDKYGTIVKKHADDFSEKTEYDTLPTYNYIVNLDKKLFVRIPNKSNDEYDLTIHPLPLLCCSGNQRGVRCHRQLLRVRFCAGRRKSAAGRRIRTRAIHDGGCLKVACSYSVVSWVIRWGRTGPPLASFLG